MKALLVTNVARYTLSEPLGIMYLCAVLRRAGHQARIEFDEPGRLDKVIGEWKPDLVGWSVISAEHRRPPQLSRDLKRKYDFFSVAGGPHPTFFPQYVQEDGLDAVCRGEGEGAIVDIAEALSGKRDIRTVPNVWVKDAGGAIQKNDVRPLIEDLDTVPFPDRDGFYCLYDRPKQQGVARFVGSRGCPFNCTYCFNQRYYEIYAGKGSRVRVRSPRNLVQEIAETVRRYPFQMAIFTDDSFPNSEEWLTEFRDVYRREVNLPFVVNQRVERITPANAKLLKEAGCHLVAIGIEHGNERLRRDMLHRYMSNDDIRGAAQALRQAGVQFQTNNLVGIPGETVHTALETLGLNLEIKPVQLSAYFIQPHPGTELTGIATAMGLYDGQEGEVVNYASCSAAWKIPDRKRLERLRDLMGFVMMVPFLRPCVPFLIRLPLRPLYKLLNRFAVGYCTKFRAFPVRLGPRRFIALFLRYITRRDPF